MFQLLELRSKIDLGLGCPFCNWNLSIFWYYFFVFFFKKKIQVKKSVFLRFLGHPIRIVKKVFIIRKDASRQISRFVPTWFVFRIDNRVTTTCRSLCKISNFGIFGQNLASYWINYLKAKKHPTKIDFIEITIKINYKSALMNFITNFLLMHNVSNFGTNFLTNFLEMSRIFHKCLESSNQFSRDVSNFLTNVSNFLTLFLEMSRIFYGMSRTFQLIFLKCLELSNTFSRDVSNFLTNVSNFLTNVWNFLTHFLEMCWTF